MREFMNFFLDQIRQTRERYTHCYTVAQERLPHVMGEGSRLRTQELLNAVQEMGECQAREKYVIDYMRMTVQTWQDAGKLSSGEAAEYLGEIPEPQLQDDVDWGI